MTEHVPSDEDFARYVKQVAMVTPEQVEVAEQEQRRNFASGVTIPMGEILVKLGAITTVQREGVEKRLAAKQVGGLQQLGPYRILRKLGEGGMGAVYLAEDDSHKNRRVALKVLPKRHAADGEFVSRFKREARSAIGLIHPHIVAAYAVGEDFGVHWYAMEFCPGEALDTTIKRLGVLPWREAIAITTQIAAALAHAHTKNIIHRDIKPANIVVSDKGIAKVLDFGLAKQLGGGQSFMTQTGVVMGTPHYIAPEQARGEKSIDGRADIYALGATLYHLLTGKTPFSGNSPAIVIMHHINDARPDPRDEIPDLPAGVAHVVCRMMAKQPHDRYPDGETLIADLELVASDMSPTGTPLNLSASAIARRRQVLADEPDHLMSYIVIAIVVLMVVAGWWYLRPNGATKIAPPINPLPVADTVAPEPPIQPPQFETIPLLPPPTSLLPPPPAIKPPPVVTSVETTITAVNPPPSLINQTRTIDLLALADPTRDAIFGTWQRIDGALVSDNAGAWADGQGASRLALPYRPPEEYDYRIVFTKRSGLHCVSQIFVARNQAFSWVMGGWGNTIFAFENMRGLHGNDVGNTTRVKQPSCLTTGQRYESVLRVRRGETTALLDGQIITRTPTNYRELTNPSVYHLRGNPGQLGIASWESPTAFHVVEVIEHSGPGTMVR